MNQTITDLRETDTGRNLQDRCEVCRGPGDLQRLAQGWRCPEHKTIRLFSKTETVRRLRAAAKVIRRREGLPPNARVEINARTHPVATAEPSSHIPLDDDLADYSELTRPYGEHRVEGAVVHLSVYAGTGWDVELVDTYCVWIGTAGTNPVVDFRTDKVEVPHLPETETETTLEERTMKSSDTVTDPRETDTGRAPVQVAVPETYDGSHGYQVSWYRPGAGWFAEDITPEQGLRLAMAVADSHARAPGVSSVIVRPDYPVNHAASQCGCIGGNDGPGAPTPETPDEPASGDLSGHSGTSAIDWARETVEDWAREDANLRDEDGEVPMSRYSELDEIQHVYGEQALDALPDLVNALDRIHGLLDAQEWDAETPVLVAEVLTGLGYVIREPGDYTGTGMGPGSPRIDQPADGVTVHRVLAIDIHDGNGLVYVASSWDHLSSMDGDEPEYGLGQCGYCGSCAWIVDYPTVDCGSCGAAFGPVLSDPKNVLDCPSEDPGLEPIAVRSLVSHNGSIVLFEGLDENGLVVTFAAETGPAQDIIAALKGDEDVTAMVPGHMILGARHEAPKPCACGQGFAGHDERHDELVAGATPRTVDEAVVYWEGLRRRLEAGEFGKGEFAGEIPTAAEMALTVRGLLTDKGGELRFLGGRRGPSPRSGERDKFIAATATLLRFMKGLSFEGPLMARFMVDTATYQRAETAATLLALPTKGGTRGLDAWGKALGIS